MAIPQMFLTRDSAEFRLNEGGVCALRILVSFGGRDWENRNRIVYSVVSPEWSYVGNDLSSGVGEQWESGRALASLLSFATACAEGGENANLFPSHVRALFLMYSDELAMAQFELESD